MSTFATEGCRGDGKLESFILSARLLVIQPTQCEYQRRDRTGWCV